MNDDQLNHIVRKSRDAMNGSFGVLSTSEQLAAAFVLNRPDWLASAGYTMAEAVERLGAKWLALIPLPRASYAMRMMETVPADFSSHRLYRGFYMRPRT